MSRIATFLKRLIRRAKMKQAQTEFLMVLIAVSFSLMVQGANVSDPLGRIAFSGGGIILLLAVIALWNRAVKQIKEEELGEKEARDNLTKAINDLVNEIRSDRTERSK